MWDLQLFFCFYLQTARSLIVSSNSRVDNEAACWYVWGILLFFCREEHLLFLGSMKLGLLLLLRKSYA
jgi:hypothetical protein